MNTTAPKARYNFRTARTTQQGDKLLVVFGQMIGAEFAPSHWKGSKTYATELGAQRAINRWVATGR